MLSKLFWSIRAILYSLFLGGIKFPSYIGKPIILIGLKRIFIGRKVRIYPNVRLEAHGKYGVIKIGDDVSIAQNVHITSASYLTIGESTTILANVFITNIDHNYQEIGIHIMKQDFIIKDTTIGENCYIGMGACIQAGTILGRQCVVGANSVVKGVFPDFSVLVGVPAKVVKRFNIDSKSWDKTNSDGSFVVTDAK